MLLSHTMIKPSVGTQGINADRRGQRNEIASLESSQLNKSKTGSDLLRKKSKKIEEISFNSCFSQREKQKTKHAANQDQAGMKTGTEGIAVAQAGAHNRTLLS